MVFLARGFPTRGLAALEDLCRKRCLAGLRFARAAMVFLARSFPTRGFAALEDLCRKRCLAGLRPLGLRLRAGIRLQLLTARPCPGYIRAVPELRGRVRATHGALDLWCRPLKNTRRGYLVHPT